MLHNVCCAIMTDELLENRRTKAGNMINHDATISQEIIQGSSSGARNLFDKFNKADEPFQYDDEYSEESMSIHV